MNSLNTIVVTLGHLQTGSVPTLNAAGGYTCPAARDDIWTKLKPAVDRLIGDLLGLKPLLIAIIFGLCIVLVLAAAFPRARGAIFKTLGWVVGASILAGILASIAIALLNFGC